MKKWRNSSPFIIATCCILVSIVGFIWAMTKPQVASAQSSGIVNCNVSADKIALDAEEQAFLAAINDYRQKNDAGPLKISNSLTQAAAWLSNDMASRNYLEHVDSFGRGLNRLNECGYSGGTKSENIAGGSKTGKAVLENWQESTKGHNENMLDPKWKVIGIARDSNASSEWGTYWTTDFGTVDDSGQQPLPTTTSPSSPPATPQSPIPSVFCLGSCPVPTSTPGAPALSGVQATPTPNSQIVPTVDPCASESAIKEFTTSTYGHHRPHRPNRPGGEGGFINLFLQLLQTLLNLIMQLIGAQPSVTPIVTPVPGQPVVPSTSPCTTPTVAPVLTSAPSQTPTLAVTVAPTTGVTSGPITSPTVAPTTVVTNAPTTQPTTITTLAPTVASPEATISVTSPAPTSQIAPTIDPCATESAVQDYSISNYGHDRHHQHPRGGFSGWLAQLLQLFLNWLIQILGMQLSTTPQVTPTTAPTAVPTTQPIEPTSLLTGSPTSLPTISPSSSPCMTPTVTTQITSTPAITPTLHPTNTPIPTPQATNTPAQ